VVILPAWAEHIRFPVSAIRPRHVQRLHSRDRHPALPARRRQDPQPQASQRDEA